METTKTSAMNFYGPYFLDFTKHTNHKSVTYKFILPSKVLIIDTANCESWSVTENFGVSICIIHSIMANVEHNLKMFHYIHMSNVTLCEILYIFKLELRYINALTDIRRTICIIVIY